MTGRTGQPRAEQKEREEAKRHRPRTWLLTSIVLLGLLPVASGTHDPNDFWSLDVTGAGDPTIVDSYPSITALNGTVYAMDGFGINFWRRDPTNGIWSVGFAGPFFGGNGLDVYGVTIPRARLFIPTANGSLVIATPSGTDNITSACACFASYAYPGPAFTTIRNARVWANNSTEAWIALAVDQAGQPRIHFLRWAESNNTYYLAQSFIAGGYHFDSMTMHGATGTDAWMAHQGESNSADGACYRLTGSTWALVGEESVVLIPATPHVCPMAQSANPELGSPWRMDLWCYQTTRCYYVQPACFDVDAPPCSGFSRVWNGTIWNTYGDTFGLAPSDGLTTVWGNATDVWALGYRGTIVHTNHTRTSWEAEPTTTGTDFLSVVLTTNGTGHAGNMAGVYLLRQTGVIPPPSTGGTANDHEFAVRVSQAQCLGDPISFNAISDNAGINDLDVYIQDAQTNVIFEQVDDSQMFSDPAGRNFYFARTYPPGPYVALGIIDNSGITNPDFFDSWPFNVPTGSCVDSPTDLSGVLDAIAAHQDDSDDDHTDIINEINNINGTGSGGLFAMGAFTDYTLGDTTLFLFFLAVMVWALYRSWWFVAGAALMGVLQAIANNHDQPVPGNVTAYLLLLVLAFWLESLAAARERRKEETTEPV